MRIALKKRLQRSISQYHVFTAKGDKIPGEKTLETITTVHVHKKILVDTPEKQPEDIAEATRR